MPTFYSRWICDLCSTMYTSREAAQRCEDTGDPPIQVKVGDEIKLKNRGGKTYTLAKITKLWVSNRYSDMGFYDIDIMDQKWKDLLPIHCWRAELDRPVYLDHKWQGFEQKVSLDTYLVTNDQGMTHNDNHAEGD